MDYEKIAEAFTIIEQLSTRGPEPTKEELEKIPELQLPKELINIMKEILKS